MGTEGLCAGISSSTINANANARGGSSSSSTTNASRNGSSRWKMGVRGRGGLYPGSGKLQMRMRVREGMQTGCNGWQQLEIRGGRGAKVVLLLLLPVQVKHQHRLCRQEQQQQ